MTLFDKLFIFLAQTKISVGSGSGQIDIPQRTAAEVIGDVLNIAYFAAGMVAVIVIVIAGYTFSTSVYDPVKITQAKNTILYAVVGLIGVIAAFFITQYVIRSLG